MSHEAEPEKGGSNKKKKKRKKEEFYYEKRKKAIGFGVVVKDGAPYKPAFLVPN